MAASLCEHACVHQRLCAVRCGWRVPVSRCLAECILQATPPDTRLRRGQRGIGFNSEQSRTLEPDLYQLAAICAVLEGANRRLHVQYALLGFHHSRFHLGVPKDLADSSNPGPASRSR